MKTQSNKMFVLLLAVVLAIGLPLVVYATTAEVSYGNWWTSTDTADNTGTSGDSAYAAYGGAPGFAGSTPVVDFYSATSTVAASRLSILTENGDGTLLGRLHANGTTTLHVNSTVGFAADSFVAIQDDGSQQFEVNKIDSIGVGTLILERAISYAYKLGAKVRELAALYSVPIGAATVTTPATLPGERGEAIGYHQNGTAATTRVNNISGHYEK